MAGSSERPLSPHLSVYKWGPHMAASIINRVTGVGLAIVGGIALIWWLYAAASGEEAYATFYECATGWIGMVFGIGLTWAFFHHLFNGIRHFVLDAGAGFELETNKRWSLAVIIGAIAATAAVWMYVFYSLSGGIA